MKSIRIAVAAAALASASCAQYGPGDGGGQTSGGGGSAVELPADHQTYTLKVRGMTCPFACVRKVREMLQAVPGVLHVAVDFEESRATVDVAPGTDPETLVRALTGDFSGRLL